MVPLESRYSRKISLQDLKSESGYLSASIGCFSSNNQYVYIPEGKEIAILDCHIKKKIGYVLLNRLHEYDIKNIQRFKSHLSLHDLFVSLDISNVFCIWSVSSVELTQINSLSLPSIQLHKKCSLLDISFIENTPGIGGDYDSLSKKVPKYEKTTTSLLYVLPIDKVTNVAKNIDVKLTLIVKQSYEEESTEQSLDPTNDSSKQIDLMQDKIDRNIHIHVYQIHLNSLLLDQQTQLQAHYVFTASVADDIKSNKFKYILLATTSANGEFIVLAYRSTLMIWQNDSRNILYIDHKSSISCMSIHPSSLYLVTGDIAGQITYWYVLCKDLFLPTKVSNATMMTYSQQLGKVLNLNHSTLFSKQKNEYKGKLVTTKEKCLGFHSNHHHHHHHHHPNVISMQPILSNMEIYTAKKHWHAHTVRDLEFSSTGNELISAGEEGVLVFWNTREDTKRFMPRFGCPIHTIVSASNNSFIYITLADNSLRVINTLDNSILIDYCQILTPLSLLQGGSLLPLTIKARICDIFPLSIMQYYLNGLPLHVITGSGITSQGLGSNSKLQFYDFVQNISHGYMTVNKQNYVSRTDHKIKKHQWTIQNVAISSNGAVLATSEARHFMMPYSNNDWNDMKQSHHGFVVSHRSDMLKKINSSDKCESNVFFRPDTVCQNDSIMNSNIQYPSQDVRHESPLKESPNHYAYDTRQVQSNKFYILKFWKITFESETCDLIGNNLISDIYNPHCHNITSLIYKPSQRNNIHQFVTVSLDTTWKLWSLNNDNQQYHCIQVASYKALPCLMGCISINGALLSILHPSGTSLWNMNTYQLLYFLPNYETIYKLPVKSEINIQFIHSTQNDTNVYINDSLLFVSYAHQFWIWDLLHLPFNIVYHYKETTEKSIVITEKSGLPYYAIYYPEKKEIQIYFIQRSKAKSISCYLQEKIPLDLQSYFILNASFIGFPLNPSFLIIDSSFKKHILPIQNSFKILSHYRSHSTLSQDQNVTLLEKDNDITHYSPINTIEKTLSTAIKSSCDVSINHEMNLKDDFNYCNFISAFILASIKSYKANSVVLNQNLVSYLNNDNSNISSVPVVPTTLLDKIFEIYSPK